LLAVSASLPTIEARVQAIESLLLGCVLNSKRDSTLLALAARIVESGGLVSVDLLAKEAGVSTRQLERRFLCEVGLTPKLLSRILRFQQVFRAVERCDGAWAPVALECGYYDQAHLIRDFNQFAQQTPGVLFAEQSPLPNPLPVSLACRIFPIQRCERRLEFFLVRLTASPKHLREEL
jgi:AraC-type DNA-binding domain-containing proteins